MRIVEIISATYLVAIGRLLLGTRTRFGRSIDRSIAIRIDFIVEADSLLVAHALATRR